MQDVDERRSGDTRERLLEIAEAGVLGKGFAATSIEELIAAVGITKSGFFYHFKDKGELAEAMLVRYIARENGFFDDLFSRADEVSNDPLQSFLAALKIFAEIVADLPNGHPGCLIASYCYQERLFDKDVRDLWASTFVAWRARFRERLDRIVSDYPPRIEISLDDLADMMSVIIDGGIILSKAIKEKQALARQIMLYRDFIRVIFSDA